MLITAVELRFPALVPFAQYISEHATDPKLLDITVNNLLRYVKTEQEAWLLLLKDYRGYCSPGESI